MIQIVKYIEYDWVVFLFEKLLKPFFYDNIFLFDFFLIKTFNPTLLIIYKINATSINSLY